MRQFFDNERGRGFTNDKCKSFLKTVVPLGCRRGFDGTCSRRAIAEDTEEFPVIQHMTFYRAKTHRFWKRQAAEIAGWVQRFSDPEFTRALGAHGEQMFDAALLRFGSLHSARRLNTRISSLFPAWASMTSR